MSDYAAITAAYGRIQPYIRRTPLLHSPALDALAGRRVWVKAECLQRTGSFKYRGACSAISALSVAEHTRGVIAFSSGNHAQGIAAAAQNNTSAKIIMPSDTPAIKVSNTRFYGAEVVFYDRATQDREQVVEDINAKDNRVLIKPFDHELVIAGQGSVGLELAQQAKAMGIDKAQVLVCCGGGGLTAGIALALAHDAPQMRVHPVEPIGFDDVGRSLDAGRIICNPPHAKTSICDAIVTNAPGALTFPIMATHCGAGIAVSDHRALQAMAMAFAHLKIVLEPGGAVALAAALCQTQGVTGDDVIVIASGGNVDAAMFQRALALMTPLAP